MKLAVTRSFHCWVWVLGCVWLSQLCPLRGAEGWTELFNGRNLDGWEQHGGKATYTVQNGVIVGTPALSTGNTFLCTKEHFADFILELDFRVDPELNSGVQFRSQCADHDTPTVFKDGEGKLITIPTGRVYGYQCETDLSSGIDRWWTAGIYDEGRRGWLYPGPAGGDKTAFTMQGRALSKPKDWNHLRIEAVGASLKTFLNGEARAAIEDGATRDGFIGLQVHSIGGDQSKLGLKAEFRNIRLQPIAAAAPAPPPAGEVLADNTLSSREQADGWKLLWDGKTFDGWRKPVSGKVPDHGWTIHDGILTVEGHGGGDILTQERFSDFELVADFRITPGANSGIKYFVNTDLSKGPDSVTGLEYQILDDLRHPDAKLGRDGDRTMASLYDLIPAAAGKKVRPVGEWNTARIVSRGHHVEHWLNGEMVLSYERGSPAFRALVAASKYARWGDFGELPDGPILLQDHGNTVDFRNLKVRVLPAQ